MIRFHNVRYRYPKTGWILKGIDLGIEDGEYVFLCGANGSGKSTLGCLFNGLIPHFLEGTLEGAVTVNGVDTRDRSVSELFPEVGFVLQNSDAHLFNSTVEDELAFGLENLGLPPEVIDTRIRKTAQTLQIEPLLKRSPMALSGGEKKLAAIASVLCLDPSVLLLDEPYAHLDGESVGRVREALRKIHRSGKTVVVIEQRLESFLQDGTRCLVLKEGKVLYDGLPQTALPVLLQERLIPTYPPRRHNFEGKSEVLSVRGLFASIEGRKLLENVSLELRRGETVALIGKNGAGKTTLIKHLNGLLRPRKGEVLLEGENIRGKSRREMAKRVGLAFQNSNDQFFKYRVRDELRAGPEMIGEKDEEWFHELCSVFDLHDLLDRSPYRLSEGQKKRVAIASVLAMKPGVLILDEPTAGQDGRSCEKLASVLNAFQDRGIAILVVTHDAEFARAVADRWVILQNGTITTEGTPEEMADSDSGIFQLSVGETEPLTYGNTEQWRVGAYGP